jgi:ATP-dependent Clp protease ATP-binding subunit ClpB
LLDAGQLAAQKHHQEVGGKHLMQALLEQEGGVTGRFLEQAGIETASFQDGLNSFAG